MEKLINKLKSLTYFTFDGIDFEKENKCFKLTKIWHDGFIYRLDLYFISIHWHF